jgi:hypothetical protein
MYSSRYHSAFAGLDACFTLLLRRTFNASQPLRRLEQLLSRAKQFYLDCILV